MFKKLHHFFFKFCSCLKYKNLQIFHKCDVWDMPEILEDNNFKIIINFVNFKTLKMFKRGKNFKLIII